MGETDDDTKPRGKRAPERGPSDSPSGRRSDADNTAPKQQVGVPFKQGQSGNPAGRPKGSRNTATLVAEALLDGEAEALTRKVIENALAGDPQALRICLDRIYPVRKDRGLAFDLPKIDTLKDAIAAQVAVLVATAAGELTLSEAAEVSKLVAGVMEALRASDLEERLSKLEEGRAA